MNTVPVFYTSKMLADSKSFSPSAGKPKDVVASWLGLPEIPLEIIEPEPVTVEQLTRAHAPSFVEGILGGSLRNGFGNHSLEVAESLRYTSGSMLSAARRALENKQVAVAPCSGFHHAEYAKAQGFCTFNGLMVTALALREENPTIRIGILDLDQHYGNGTDHIIQHLGINWIEHYTAGKFGFQPRDADKWLLQVGRILHLMADCDLILYQAGADAHVADPYGGWMTNEQLALRDQLVFHEARVRGIPLAWNLAGGYQDPLRKVLDIHDNTMKACAQVFLTK